MHSHSLNANNSGHLRLKSTPFLYQRAGTRTSESATRDGDAQRDGQVTTLAVLGVDFLKWREHAPRIECDQQGLPCLAWSRDGDERMAVPMPKGRPRPVFRPSPPRRTASIA